MSTHEITSNVKLSRKTTESTIVKNHVNVNLTTALNSVPDERVELLVATVLHGPDDGGVEHVDGVAPLASALPGQVLQSLLQEIGVALNHSPEERAGIEFGRPCHVKKVTSDLSTSCSVSLLYDTYHFAPRYV